MRDHRREPVLTFLLFYFSLQRGVAPLHSLCCLCLLPRIAPTSVPHVLQSCEALSRSDADKQTEDRLPFKLDCEKNQARAHQMCILEDALHQCAQKQRSGRTSVQQQHLTFCEQLGNIRKALWSNSHSPSLFKHRQRIILFRGEVNNGWKWNLHSWASGYFCTGLTGIHYAATLGPSSEK